MTKLISYIRVSTGRQAKSGLGQAAQQETVDAYIHFHEGELIGQYQEMESGKKCDRPKLLKALQDCKERGATLIVAKLDRLARDAKFLLSLVDGGVPVIFCDFPEISTCDPITGRLILTMLAAVAEFEGKRSSQRTREGLAARKRRGLPMGARLSGCQLKYEDRVRGAKKGLATRLKKASDFWTGFLPRIHGMRVAGYTLKQIADRLNNEGRMGLRGKKWSILAIHRALERQITTAQSA